MIPPKKNDQITIVIADDDATTRFVLRLLLQEQMYQVVGEASDGKMAVDLCKSLKPDIAFIDIQMPKLDGHEAVQHIGLINPDIGIIMISALSSLDNVRKALEAGAGGFVVKPFSAAKLIAAIDNCLKNVA